MSNAIKVRDLKKTFAEYTAVDSVSFDIPYGQITALLGSNGAGKSTTLNMIAGITTPTTGEIEICGMSYAAHYKQIKTKLGYLTSDMALYNALTVQENLTLLGRLKGFKESHINQRISELDDFFNLHEFIESKFSNLSSGQKQRSLICASIFHDPEILIFDEVTASLDIIISKTIMDFLKKEKAKGKAIIFSTHILSEVEYISDKILFIKKGKLVKETTYQELMAESGVKTLTEAFHGIFQDEKKAA